MKTFTGEKKPSMPKSHASFGVLPLKVWINALETLPQGYSRYNTRNEGLLDKARTTKLIYFTDRSTMLTALIDVEDTTKMLDKLFSPVISNCIE